MSPYIIFQSFLWLQILIFGTYLAYPIPLGIGSSMDLYFREIAIYHTNMQNIFYGYAIILLALFLLLFYKKNKDFILRYIILLLSLFTAIFAFCATRGYTWYFYGNPSRTNKPIIVIILCLGISFFYLSVYMVNIIQSLKITKNKTKLFFFFLFIIFIFSLLSIFPTTIIIRRAGVENFQEQINIFNKFFGIFRSLLVPHIILIFLKKEFFIKKYFTEFAKIFFIVFISGELAAIIPILFYKIFSTEVFLSNPIQVTGFILKLFISYVAICFIDKIGKEKVKA